MFKKILFPVDLGNLESQEKARLRALQMAELCSSELHVLSVVAVTGLHAADMYLPDDLEKRLIEQAQTDLHTYAAEKLAKEGLHVNAAVSEGTIYKEILAYAETYDINLIVLASHRPELSDYLIGPNAARVVRHANCSVMVIRGD